MRWIDPPPLPSEADLSAAMAAGMPAVVARVLASRGLVEAAAVEFFLRPRLRDISDPFQVGGMQEVADRILGAIRNNEATLIVGDYDVDGITSTALLWSALRQFVPQVEAVVPRRFDEGYGLSTDVLERGLRQHPATLVIAVDCGTNSVAEAGWLRQRGVDLVVIDHHQPGEESLLGHSPLVNPHARDNTDAPWFHLCAVGLAFKVVHAVVKQLRHDGHPVAEAMTLRDYLDLVAMGTVADLVPLIGENRIMVYFGLEELAQRRRPGVAALMDVATVDCRKGIKPVDISFRIAPRINAGGRLADAALPLQLLLSRDPDQCRKLAVQLDAMNRERQDIERQICSEAEERVRAMDNRMGLVLYDASWHTGVVGIVAGKLARVFQRPCIVLGREGDSIKGSGRSFGDINLVEALAQCSQHLDAWGGHPMAVGVTASEARMDSFAAAFDAAVSKLCKGTLPEAELRIAAWLTAEDLDDIFFDAVDRLNPFGQGNPEPLFAVRGAVLAGTPTPFGSDNFRFQVSRTNGEPLQGIAWHNPSIPPAGTPVDLAFRARWNDWNGRRFPQLELADWRHSESPRRGR